MDSFEKNQVLQSALNKWGAATQAGMCMTECGELTAALGAYFVQGRDKDSNVIDEIADVQIMLDQMKLIFDQQAIESRIEYKLDRLKGILLGNVEHPHSETVKG